MLEPTVGRLSDAARHTRLSHLAMLDQETGLRAFLITGTRGQLQPYERGRASLQGHNDAVTAALADEPELLALFEEVERRQEA